MKNTETQPSSPQQQVVKLRWEYSRNQMRHWVNDGELYRSGFPSESGFRLFEIRTDRDPMKVRSRLDRFRLLHKGKQVDSHRVVKVLKETAAQIHAKQLNADSSDRR